MNVCIILCKLVPNFNTALIACANIDSIHKIIKCNTVHRGNGLLIYSSAGIFSEVQCSIQIQIKAPLI